MHAENDTSVSSLFTLWSGYAMEKRRAPLSQDSSEEDAEAGQIEDMFFCWDNVNSAWFDAVSIVTLFDFVDASLK